MNSDEQKVRQTLLNLLGNAAKFTSCGEVLLRVHEEGGRVVFEVSDSGIGMDEEQCVKVFEAFAQGSIPKGSWQVGTQFGGTGLGLTISKRFVEMLGGEIHCKSEVGKGTTFWMTLPKE
jgi:signal transduction histidine kinase